MPNLLAALDEPLQFEPGLRERRERARGRFTLTERSILRYKLRPS